MFPYFVAQTILLTLLDGLIVARVFAGDSSTIQAAAWVTLVSVPAIMSQQFGLSILQGLEQFRDFNLLRVAPVALYAVGAVVAWFGGSTSIVFVVMAWSGSWLLVAIATQIRAQGVLNRRTVQPAKGDVGAAVVYRFGLKAVVGWVSPVEVLRLDQAVVGLFLSTASLGLYVVALSFTNLTRFVAQSVGMVGYPNIAAEKDSARAWHSMWRFVGLAAVVCTALVVVLELTVGWLLPLFFGAEFSDAVGLARLLIIATLLTSVRRVLGDAVRGVGQPSLGSIAEALSWIVLLPCLALLTSAYGTTGVAVSLILAGLTSLTILTALVFGYVRGPAQVIGPRGSSEPGMIWPPKRTARWWFHGLCAPGPGRCVLSGDWSSRHAMPACGARTAFSSHTRSLGIPGSGLCWRS